MDDKLIKLKEYLQMETEISHDEFKDFYTSIITQLNTEYNDMDQKTCLKARYICSIVKANAEARSHKNKTTNKSFRKMEAKLNFWMEAIDHRLKKEGMTQADIETAMTEINEEM